MPTSLTWTEIGLRLLCTVVASALIGMNRGEHGHPAGLRTTVLVCLAASLSMIQVNALLSLAGKPGNSFVMLDLMRLPLGILSGMGFIGAGAIIRRDGFVKGVTTAATLWFVTVIGLCFGGGQIALAWVATILGLGVLSVFKWLEVRVPQDREAMVSLELSADGPSNDSLVEQFRESGFCLKPTRVVLSEQGKMRKVSGSLYWRGKAIEADPPSLLEKLAQAPGVISLEWSTGPLH